MIEDNTEDYSKATRPLRQVKAARFISRARAEASERGFLSQDEIDAEIAVARCERDLIALSWI